MHMESAGVRGTPTQTIVKNTFVDVVDENQDTARLRRSASEGDLSKSSDQSQDEKGYWLPSLWSSSNSSDKKRIDGIQGSIETTPWLYQNNGSPLDTHRSGIGFSPKGCYPENAYAAQTLIGMATASASSHQSRTRSGNKEPRQVSKAKPPGIFQGGPPAPPRVNEPAAPEEECIPSANFPYLPNTSSSQPVQVQARRHSEEVRNMLSSIWGQSPNEQEARSSGPAVGYPQSEGHAPQAEGRSGVTSDAERDLLVRQIHSEIRGRLPMEKLVDLAEKGELATIPRNETNALTSIGSTQHLSGACTPCAYWFKGICKYSIACHYCHFVHPGQKSKRLRPSKQTRMRIRKWEAELSAQNENTSAPYDSDEYQNEPEQDDEGSHEEMTALTTQSRHLLNL